MKVISEAARRYRGAVSCQAVTRQSAIVCVNLFNPGANLFVVVQTQPHQDAAESSLPGVATGDAFIPGWGFSVWRRSLLRKYRVFSYQNCRGACLPRPRLNSISATVRLRK